MDETLRSLSSPGSSLSGIARTDAGDHSGCAFAFISAASRLRNTSAAQVSGRWPSHHAQQVRWTSIHFSQGDGEITFCGAIEMAGYLDIRVSILKGGMEKYAIRNPLFIPSPLTPDYKRHIIFEGISVDEAGKQHYLDPFVAYKMACLNAIEYMKKFGYTGEQAYAILGTAPVEGHISGIVDIPNACATLWLPTEIFDFDIMPNASGPTRMVAPGTDLAFVK